MGDDTFELMAELAPRPARTLSQYRQRNEITPKEACLFGVPAGFALGFAQTEASYMLMGAGVFAVFAVIGLVHLIRHYPRSIGASQDVYLEGDYPAIAYWAPVIPLALPLAMAPLSAAGWLPDISLAPPVEGILTGAVSAFALPLGLWAMFSQSFRIGRRRMQRIVAEDPLEGVTDSAMQLADAHLDILTALVTAGAVQGNTTTTKALSRLMQVELDTLPDALQELKKHGLVKVEDIGLRSKVESWRITLSPTGVRCLYQLGRR